MKNLAMKVLVKILFTRMHTDLWKLLGHRMCICSSLACAVGQFSFPLKKPSSSKVTFFGGYILEQKQAHIFLPIFDWKLYEKDSCGKGRGPSRHTMREIQRQPLSRASPRNT